MRVCSLVVFTHFCFRLQFSTALQFAVVSLYRSWFGDSRCCSRFFGSFMIIISCVQLYYATQI